MARILRPVSSIVSRSAQVKTSSPWSRWPPGKDHCPIEGLQVSELKWIFPEPSACVHSRETKPKDHIGNGSRTCAQGTYSLPGYNTTVFVADNGNDRYTRVESIARHIVGAEYVTRNCRAICDFEYSFFRQCMLRLYICCKRYRKRRYRSREWR